MRSYSMSRQVSCGGWTYLAMLIFLAGVSALAAYALRAGELQSQRDAEEELLLIGEEFSRALRSYAHATPAGLRLRPMSLQDLVRDPRYPNPVRHLRQIRPDPLTRTKDWAVVRDEQGAIVGIHSPSMLRPIRSRNLVSSDVNQPPRAESYADWVFRDHSTVPP